MAPTKTQTTTIAKTVAETPGLSRIGLPEVFEFVDMRATLADEKSSEKKKVVGTFGLWTKRAERGLTNCTWTFDVELAIAVLARRGGPAVEPERNSSRQARGASCNVMLMSSDTFTIHVTKIDGTKVEFLCETGTAAGLNDYAVTRSFALMIIEDGMPYVRDGKGTPLQAELRRLADSDTPPVWQENFHKEHVGKFIASTKLVERIGVILDEGAWKHGRFELQQYDEYPLHRFVIHAEVTDPKWLVGLKEGSSYGTTAFDAWWEDPTRQANVEFIAITRRASKWKAPTKKRTKKAEGAPAAEAPKKSAVKRGAVRKAPKA